MKAKELSELSDKEFSKRGQLMCLMQEIAENFYPERADFTRKRALGAEFADNLTTSYPLLCRRDLGNALGAMARPTSKEWFHTGVMGSDLRNDIEARRYLEWASGVQRRAMYDPDSLFVRACKEADHDYASFGQCVISHELSRDGTHLLYRTWHLRDVAWCENAEGKVGQGFRNWKPTLRTLSALFPGRLHSEMTRDLEKDPYKEANIRHFFLDEEWYSGDFDDGYKPFNAKRKLPFVSIYYDVDHEHILESRPARTRYYTIPRWQTVSGSQYAYSPAVVAALPDARLIQSMTYTLLEAGEKTTNPPMVATQEAIRSDIDVRAGRVTWVSADYDERQGEVLRPMSIDARGVPLGIDMFREVRAMIHEAFYLNKMAMPPSERVMTAFEAGQRVQEYIRQALPLFEPIEMDYNASLCEGSFDLLLYGGAFGDPRLMPRSLANRRIQFKFESPLHDAIERQQGQRFLEGKQLLAEAAAIDPGAVDVVDAVKSLRGALQGVRYPAEWTRSEDEVAARNQARMRAEAQQALLNRMEQGAGVANTLAQARATSQETAQAELAA